jgi:hypothetical protein
VSKVLSNNLKRRLMNRIVLLGVLTLGLFTFVAAKGKSGGTVHVSGYTTKSGKYVAPYYRSAPGSGSSSHSSGTGIPCGNSYISAKDVCHIGTTTTTDHNFANCTEALAAGFSNILEGDPSYRAELDRDSDGIACESGSNGGSDNTNISDKTQGTSLAQRAKVAGAIENTGYITVRDLSKIIDVSASEPEITVETTLSTLHVTQGSTTAVLNGKSIKLNAAPFLLDGLNYIPIKALLSLDCTYNDVGQGNYQLSCPLTKDSPIKVVQFSDLNLSTKTPELNTVSQKRVTPIATQPSRNLTSKSKNNNTTKCPKFELEPFDIKVTVPAIFPNPESTKAVNHLECEGYIFDYTGAERKYHKDIKISGLSWQVAWKIINKYLSNYLTMDGNAMLAIDNDTVNISNKYGMAINPNSVAGISFNGGKLEPVLFDGKITPLKLRSGVNSIYLKIPDPFTSYKYINIDTVNQTITLKADPDGI